MAYKIGTTSASLATLASLGVPNPRGRYYPEVERVRLGNGKFKALGAPRSIWEWGFLSQADRDILRAYCTGVSSNIYIETITNDSSSAYDVFAALMHWPESEERDAGRRIGFVIEFTNLVEV